MNSENYRSMCHKCLRPTKACFCENIVPFTTLFEFCILMHPKEAKHSHIGTGRMANIALSNCQIIIGENFDNNEKVQKFLQDVTYFPMMLYPGEHSFNISKHVFAKDYFQNRKPLVFILDGTWPCAKSMMRDSQTLHGLPRISFDAVIESKFSIRHQPAKFCLSTIESIYQVLSNLESQGLENLGEKKEVLLTCLQKLVDFQKKCADDPNLKTVYRRGYSYKDPSLRKVSKKWQDRKICFEDRNY